MKTDSITSCKTCGALNTWFTEEGYCYPCQEDQNEYLALREEGHSHYQAGVMAGILDPEE